MELTRKDIEDLAEVLDVHYRIGPTHKQNMLDTDAAQRDESARLREQHEKDMATVLKMAEENANLRQQLAACREALRALIVHY